VAAPYTVSQAERIGLSSEPRLARPAWRSTPTCGPIVCSGPRLETPSCGSPSAPARSFCSVWSSHWRW